MQNATMFPPILQTHCYQVQSPIYCRVFHRPTHPVRHIQHLRRIEVNFEIALDEAGSNEQLV